MMKEERRMRIVSIIVGFLTLTSAVCEAQSRSVVWPIDDRRSSSASSIPLAAAGEILREIDDPHNGNRWLLLRDKSHPAGPGQLVLVSPIRRAVDTPKQTGREPDAPPPVIRAGNHIVIEEHSAIVDARLEAIAVEPAWPGAAFSARLTIGGRLVRALAVEPGRATLQEVAGQ
jgi:hypothetical protein